MNFYCFSNPIKIKETVKLLLLQISFKKKKNYYTFEINIIFDSSPSRIFHSSILIFYEIQIILEIQG